MIVFYMLMQITMEILDDFCKVAGMKINDDKTKILKLNEKDPITIFGNIVLKDMVKLIGIHIECDEAQCESENWESGITKFEKLLND